MGGACSKKGEQQLKEEEKVETFHAETKLNAVSNFEILEWNDMLRQSELSMDQHNLDLATKKKILQDMG